LLVAEGTREPSGFDAASHIGLVKEKRSGSGLPRARLRRGDGGARICWARIETMQSKEESPATPSRDSVNLPISCHPNWRTSHPCHRHGSRRPQFAAVSLLRIVNTAKMAVKPAPITEMLRPGLASPRFMADRTFSERR
jgi:hypothetical protein